MNLLTAFVAASLAGCGLYMALSRNLARLALGLALLSTAVNLVLFMTGRLRSDQPPLIPDGARVLGLSADPLPQALVLTAIVIGFALTVVLMSLVLRAWRGEGTINAARIITAEPPFPEDDGEDADAR